MNQNETNNEQLPEASKETPVQENLVMSNDRGGDLVPKEVHGERELTFGEKLVGVSFNPSKDPNVDEAKRLCAALADLVEQNYKNHDSTNLGKRLFEHTIGEILNAQMNTVKCLTLTH